MLNLLDRLFTLVLVAIATAVLFAVLVFRKPHISERELRRCMK